MCESDVKVPGHRASSAAQAAGVLRHLVVTRVLLAGPEEAA